MWLRGKALSDYRAALRRTQGTTSQAAISFCCPAAPLNTTTYLIDSRLSFPDAEARRDEAVSAQTFDRLWDEDEDEDDT